MDESEVYFMGVDFIAEEYSGNDCGAEHGKECAFTGQRNCSEFKCTPDKRADGRNVIFVEKKP